MNRRKFLASLFGLATAPWVVPNVLAQQPVKRTLDGAWSFELEQDLQCFHAIDTDSELVKQMSAEIQKEIDQEMVRAIVVNPNFVCRIEIV